MTKLAFFVSLVILILMVTGVAPFNLFIVLLPLIIAAGIWVALFLLAFVAGLIALSSK